jgi:hypothetical protein
MKSFLPAYGYLVLSCLLLSGITQSQPGLSSSAVQPKVLQKGLFEADEILHIKIAGNLREVLNDRGENPKYHELMFSWFDMDSSEISVPVKIKTRGHFRKDRSNCTYPPLLINFLKKELPLLSIFDGQNKLKLVMPCVNDDYVVREWLLYKLYNLVTPHSFRARLVRVTMDDIVKKKKTSFYGILLEDEEQMARRNEVVIINRRMLNAQNTEPAAFLSMAVFEYMIGNTDWSVPYLHNIRLVAKDSLGMATVVPYDFDHSGMINAPYAEPAELLEMRSVVERRYRGYCIPDMKTFEPVIALFNQLKKDFYSAYTNCSLLSPRYIKTATKYLDEFYTTINNPKSMQAAFRYPCNGTDIIIKGLRKD